MSAVNRKTRSTAVALSFLACVAQLTGCAVKTTVGSLELADGRQAYKCTGINPAKATWLTAEQADAANLAGKDCVALALVAQTESAWGPTVTHQFEDGAIPVDEVLRAKAMPAAVGPSVGSQIGGLAIGTLEAGASVGASVAANRAAGALVTGAKAYARQADATAAKTRAEAAVVEKDAQTRRIGADAQASGATAPKTYVQGAQINDSGNSAATGGAGGNADARAVSDPVVNAQGGQGGTGGTATANSTTGPINNANSNQNSAQGGQANATGGTTTFGNGTGATTVNGDGNYIGSGNNSGSGNGGITGNQVKSNNCHDFAHDGGSGGVSPSPITTGDCSGSDAADFLGRPNYASRETNRTAIVAVAARISGARVVYPTKTLG